MIKLYKLNVSAQHIEDLFPYMPTSIVYDTYEGILNSTYRFTIDKDDNLVVIECHDNGETCCYIYKDQNDNDILDRLSKLKAFW
jgi:hypothetical protein